MVQLRYWLQSADELGIHEHPIKQMEKLGYKILHGVPQTIGDQWWFTVDRRIDPLPEYLEVMEYDLKDWGFYDEWENGILTFDGLSSICHSYGFDSEKIGLYFLTVLCNGDKIDITE